MLRDATRRYIKIKAKMLKHGGFKKDPSTSPRGHDGWGGGWCYASVSASNNKLRKSVNAGKFKRLIHPLSGTGGLGGTLRGVVGKNETLKHGDYERPTHSLLGTGGLGRIGVPRHYAALSAKTRMRKREDTIIESILSRGFVNKT